MGRDFIMKYMTVDNTNFDEVFSDVNSIARVAFEDYFDQFDENYLEITEAKLNQFIEEMNDAFRIIKLRLLLGSKKAEAAKEKAMDALEKIADQTGFSVDELIEAIRES